jgi:hypothetical protein
MTVHPTHEELFEAAEATSPTTAELGAHLASCDECRATFARFQGGAALLQEARGEELAEVRWDRIDDVIAREAERVAAEIREANAPSNVRPLRRSRAWVSGGIALAAAAAVALYVYNKRPREERPVAVQTPPVQTPTAPEITPSRAPWEGAVLLAAGGAVWHESNDGAGVRLAEARALREGGRIETTRVGRAVVTVQPGWKLDVRPDTDVTMRTLREGAATVALAHGAVALHPSEGAANEGTRVSVTSGRWTVGVEGAVVARTDVHSLRVVVLAGRVNVGAEGAPRTEFMGPIELELPESGASATVVSRTAEDPTRIDLSLLGGDGALQTLPAIDPAATLTVLGDGALPSGLEAARFSRVCTIRARTSQGLVSLEVGPGRVLRWVPVAATVASTQPQANRAQPQTNAPDVQPAVPAADLRPDEVRLLTGSLASRSAPCFLTLREQNICPREMTGNVDFDVLPDGRIAVSSIDPSATCARACIERNVQFVRGRATGGTATLRVPIR